MLKDETVWVNAVLSGNVKIEKFVRDIDAAIAEQSLDRAGDVFTGAELIIDKMMRKRRLITEKYIYSRSVAELSEESGLPVRSVYRFLEKGIGMCASWLVLNGFSAAWFERVYGAEKWLKNPSPRGVGANDGEKLCEARNGKEGYTYGQQAGGR